ncbi:MAG: hypothetical protein J0L93_11470 [Deltaproteobacteria bacterium]|nr:hypothetical protein [Deltaproteobacteria bacterium]
MKTIYYSFLSVSIIFCVGFKLHAEDLESARVQEIENYLSSIRYDDGKTVLSSKQIIAETLAFAESKKDVGLLEKTFISFREFHYFNGGAQLFDKSTALKKALHFSQNETASFEKLEKLKEIHAFVSKLEKFKPQFSGAYFPSYVFSQIEAFDIAAVVVDENIEPSSLKAAYSFFSSLKNSNLQPLLERKEALEKARAFSKAGKDLEELKKSYQESYTKFDGNPALSKNPQLALLKAEESVQKETELKKKAQEATAQADETLKLIASKPSCPEKTP